MAIKAKQKGNGFELKIAEFFRTLGWTDCVTSRSESKRTDDLGIDLCYTKPFQVQAKAWERAPSYHEVLKNMPNKKGVFNLLFHKRNRKGTIVVMPMEDFEEIVRMLIDNKLIKP